CFHLNLVIELHRKLDLSRIVGCKTSRPDFSEGSAVEVAGIRNRRHAVAPEVGRIECRMIEDVKDLSPELHGEAFANRDVLKGREVEFSQAGSLSGRRITTENRRTSLLYTSRCSGSPQRARLLESQGVPKPVKFSVRVFVQAKLLALSSDL